MPTILALVSRLAAEIVQGNLHGMRRRLVRSLALLSALFILVVVAVTLGAAAVAIALADWLGLVPALLAIAAVATIGALILALVISTQARRPARSGLDLLDLAGRKPMRVDPMMVAVGALAAGLLLGRRRK